MSDENDKDISVPFRIHLTEIRQNSGPDEMFPLFKVIFGSMFFAVALENKRVYHEAGPVRPHPVALPSEIKNHNLKRKSLKYNDLSSEEKKKKNARFVSIACEPMDTYICIIRPGWFMYLRSFNFGAETSVYIYQRTPNGRPVITEKLAIVYGFFFFFLYSVFF